MIHDKSIIVGACDWDHSEWRETFYPEDLPEDWRLSYYANEFSAVLVAQQKWQAEDVDFEQWAEDVPEGFLFYFLSDDFGDSDAKLKSQIQKHLGAAFAGFVPVSGNTQVALIDFKIKTLREWKEWLLKTECGVVFLVGENVHVKSIYELQSLVELMSL